jgi:hypothetical protein
VAGLSLAAVAPGLGTAAAGAAPATTTESTAPAAAAATTTTTTVSAPTTGVTEPATTTTLKPPSTTTVGGGSTTTSSTQPPVSPPSSRPAPGTTRSSGTPAGASAVAPSRSDAPSLLSLLETSAARRRHLDGRLSDQEAALTHLQDAAKTLQDQLAGAQSGEGAAAGSLQRGAADLDRVEREVAALSRIEAAATRRRELADKRCATVASRAQTPRLQSPLPAPAPSALGAPGLPSLAVCLSDRTPVKPSAAARALPDAVARRDALSTERDRRQADLTAAQAATGAAQGALDANAQALEAQRQSLAAMRQQLSAALQDPLSMGQTSALGGGHGVEPSPLARADIPASYLALYRKAAATCSGLAWTVLAAIGKIESDHGRSTAPGVRSGTNVAGAMGPMQFLAPTWQSYGADGNGDGRRDVYQPGDAVMGAAADLCAGGAGKPDRLPDAIWGYNHADWYVDQVLVQALSYGTGGLELATAPADAVSLVANRNLTLSAAARDDLLTGKADRRVVQLLAAIAAHHRITVGVIRTGHSEFVHGTTRVSNHFSGRAVDITTVDGAPVTASNDAALDLALAVLTADPAIRPSEFGSPWAELGSFPGAFSDGDHQDHLHVGWRA